MDVESWAQQGGPGGSWNSAADAVPHLWNSAADAVPHNVTPVAGHASTAGAGEWGEYSPRPSTPSRPGGGGMEEWLGRIPPRKAGYTNETIL